MRGGDNKPLIQKFKPNNILILQQVAAYPQIEFMLRKYVKWAKKQSKMHSISLNSYFSTHTKNGRDVPKGSQKSLEKLNKFFLQSKKYQFVSEDKKITCQIIEFSSEEIYDEIA